MIRKFIKSNGTIKYHDIELIPYSKNDIPSYICYNKKYAWHNSAKVYRNNDLPSSITEPDIYYYDKYNYYYRYNGYAYYDKSISDGDPDNILKSWCYINGICLQQLKNELNK